MYTAVCMEMPRAKLIAGKTNALVFSYSLYGLSGDNASPREQMFCGGRDTCCK
jgi:hypothetical protein